MNPINNNGAEQLLQQMRAMAEQAGGGQANQANGPQDGPQFMEAMQNALETVNEIQQESGALEKAFLRGEDVSLTELMVAKQQSKVAFEATKQVRTRLVEAYQKIYNMPV